MDLLEIDKRLEKNLERLETSLKAYEKMITDASDLKEYFENQTIGLRNSYKRKVNQLEEDLKKGKELLSSNIQDFNDLYNKIVGLFAELNAEKKEFDRLKKHFNEAVDEKWENLEKVNSERLSKFETMIVNRIDALEKYYNEKISEIDSVNRRNAESLFNLKMKLEDSSDNVIKKFKKLFGKK